VKLFDRFVGSTLWCKDDKVLRVWIYLLLDSDSSGNTNRATIPGMARECGYSIDDVERCIKELESPDPYSTNIEEEGRRIIRNGIGGWYIVSYQKYHEQKVEKGLSMHPDAVRQRKYRAKKRKGENYD
jgi:hypothetical protein